MTAYQYYYRNVLIVLAMLPFMDVLDKIKRLIIHFSPLSIEIKLLYLNILKTVCALNGSNSVKC